MDCKDYYQILGLDRIASADQIKKAYRKLAMQYHPDRNHGKEEWANEKFKDINEAFSVLGDPGKRSQYDQFGTVGTVGDIFDSQAARNIFDDFIQDCGEAGLDFGFIDDIFGDTIHNTRFRYHNVGRGSGGSKNTKFHVPGDVKLEDDFNHQSFSNYFVEYVFSLTSDQAAKGLEKELKRNGKKLKVKIPANIRNGSKVRLKNALHLTDGSPGDIIIHIKIE
ncbi:MAG: DnaJ domain-containing protein [Dehalococcoidales bacterium]|nr:MAG: DnaJ domain-containing protein [Dehalococcoidales bacterium]